MSLAILCGTLEPGADGVGDYSALLAAACQRLGTPVVLLALHDHYVRQPLQVARPIEGVLVPTLRLPAALSRLERCRLAQTFLDAQQVQVLSLQFVPYGFHPRGLPWWLPALMRQLMKSTNPSKQQRSLHLMFHEIWIGLAAQSSRSARVIGRLQRVLIGGLVKSAQPCLIHTSNEFYRICLASIGVQAQISPLYSNLPKPEQSAHPDPHYYTACLFGRIPPEWDPLPVVEVLLKQASRLDRHPRLRILGRAHSSDDWLNALQHHWPWLSIEQYGPIASPQELACNIQSCDVGLATTPWPLIEKSGAVAAYLALGLPVVVSRMDWKPRSRWPAASPEIHANLFPLDHWGQTLSQPMRQVVTPHDVALNLLRGLSSSSDHHR